MAKRSSKLPRRTAAEDFVDFERRKYAREWEISSNHLAINGCYKWMGEKFGVRGFVLEVGCGSGLSTIELVRQGNKVISIEENTACLRRAKQAIENAGYKVRTLVRGSIREKGARQHDVVYGDIKLPSLQEFDVVLIEGNFLKDQKLFDCLNRMAPFDGIVCWLIGTHSGMAFNSCIDLGKVSSPMHYRLKTQNFVYEVANALLKPKGILHIVDRGQTPTSQELIEDFFSSHKDQASVTSIVPTEFDYIPYEEPAHDHAVKMVVTVPSHGNLQSIKGLSLLSVRSVKPEA